MTIEEKRNALRGYLEAGITHICPAKAAPILGCAPYSLNVSAKLGRMPDSAYYFAGRNLRVSVAWVNRTSGINAKSPGDVAASTGADQKVRTHYTTTAKEAQAL